MPAASPALHQVADWLACPNCRAALQPQPGALRCPAGHSFDIARQGYVNLLGRAAPANADTAEMLAARARFLGLGHYQLLAAEIAKALAGATRLLEVGAGTGYYLAQLLEANPNALGLATDVSVPACRRAASAHPRMAAVVADTWAGLPMTAGAVDGILCVFAPRNPAEFARVLYPGGRVVVAIPGPGHLAELRQTHDLLGIRQDKLSELVTAFLPHGLELVDSQLLTAELQLTAEAATDLIAMGPNAFHRTAEQVSAISVSFEVSLASFEATS